MTAEKGTRLRGKLAFPAVLLLLAAALVLSVVLAVAGAVWLGEYSEAASVAFLFALNWAFLLASQRFARGRYNRRGWARTARGT